MPNERGAGYLRCLGKSGAFWGGVLISITPYIGKGTPGEDETASFISSVFPGVLFPDVFPAFPGCPFRMHLLGLFFGVCGGIDA